VNLIRRAIAICSTSACYYSNLGNALTDLGQFDEAISANRQAIEIQPDDAIAHNGLGIALQANGQPDEAITAYRQAIHLKPDFAESNNNLGIALKEKGQLDDAIVAFRQALKLKPDLVEALNNLGDALTVTGQLDDAISACRRAVRLKPDYAEAHYNLGNALRDKLQIEESVASFREAIRLKPDYAKAHFNLALVLLVAGDFKRGLAEYEWRPNVKSVLSGLAISQPQWKGEELGGRSILLVHDQGFGDSIQFVRYVPMVAHRGGRVIMTCHPQLARLFERLPLTRVIINGQPIPPFDMHCSLAALPRIFATDLNSIPNAIPYLTNDPALVENWGKKLGPTGRWLRVGLAWAGNPANPSDWRRSIQPQQLFPLTKLNYVTLYSLQKGRAASHALPPEMKLIDFTPELADFADTAALIENLDLVIAVDTAVAHLAGALGKPVWVLLPYNPDWRWMLEREDSPWYPTMRLFRQRNCGHWAGVIERVIQALAAFRGRRRIE
jgi:Flp pilus assembly protein TadD